MDPIYDETIEAPTRFKVKRNGHVNEIANLHVLPQDATAGSNRTIGAIRNRVSPGLLEGLFQSSNSQESLEEKLEEMKQQLTSDGSQEEEEGGNGSLRLAITASVLI